MPTVRRSETTRVQPNKIGNDTGSKEKGLGIKRTGSGTQPALGFSAKKSLHKSPAKKKHQDVLEASQSIDLTSSSPTRPTFALFNRTNKARTGKAAENPFEDEDVEEKPDVVEVKRDEFGFVSTVPEDYAPLGKGKATKEMIANLETPSVDAEEASESEEQVEVKEIEKPKEKLNVKDKKWDKVYKETQEKMGGVDVQPIHCTPKSHNRVHHILRVFDLSSEWGPCVGITRLERWNRAEAWGLEPPKEVRDILLTQEASSKDEYKETIFHDRGIYVP